MREIEIETERQTDNDRQTDRQKQDRETKTERYKDRDRGTKKKQRETHWVKLEFLIVARVGGYFLKTVPLTQSYNTKLQNHKDEHYLREFWRRTSWGISLSVRWDIQLLMR